MGLETRFTKFERPPVQVAFLLFWPLLAFGRVISLADFGAYFEAYSGALRCALSFALAFAKASATLLTGNPLHDRAFIIPCP